MPLGPSPQKTLILFLSIKSIAHNKKESSLEIFKGNSPFCVIFPFKGIVPRGTFSAGGEISYQFLIDVLNVKLKSHVKRFQRKDTVFFVKGQQARKYKIRDNTNLKL